MTYLIKTREDQRIRTRTVQGPTLRIGRGVQSDLRFEDSAVALDHAVIEADKKGFNVTDQNSLTGCYVNGKRIRKADLNDGDRIEIGPYRIDIQIAPTGGTLTLDLHPIAPPPIHRREEIGHKKIDYVKAYSLNRGIFNQWFLTLLLLGGAAAAMGFLFLDQNWGIFRPGGVSEAHALFTNQCGRCHEPWNGPAEQSCQKCHAVSKHQENELKTPSCLICHQEHRGKKELISVTNTRCVECHRNLQTAEGMKTAFEKTVSDFSSSHPKFALTVDDPISEKRIRISDSPVDTGQLKLNHHLHLKPDLKGPNGPVQLVCRDCHQSNPDGKRMIPIQYERHCGNCHELGFDPRFPNPYVPHADPETIHAYLLMVYAERRAEMLPVPKSEGRLAKNPLPPAPFKLDPWVIEKVSNAEEHLYKSTCTICHEVRVAHPFLAIEKTGVPEVWFPYSIFSHHSHRQLECTACHRETGKSKKTSDLLLPGIQICRECHRNPKSGFVSFQAEKAPTECTACHLYHDRSQEVQWEKPLSIEEFLNGS